MAIKFERRKVAHEDGLFVGNIRSPIEVAAAATGRVNRAFKKASGALGAAADTAGAMISWVNPEGVDILIEYVRLITTAVATSACTADIGVTSANATTKVDNLIDGKDLNAATGTFDNIASAGTNGKPKYLCPAGKWVTGSVASGASAGLVGTYEIYYTIL